MHRNIPVEYITIIIYGVEFDQPRADRIMEVVEEEEVEEESTSVGFAEKR